MFSFHLLSNTAAWGNKTHKFLPTEKILVSFLTVLREQNVSFWCYHLYKGAQKGSFMMYRKKSKQQNPRWKTELKLQVEFMVTKHRSEMFPSK